MNIAAWKVEQIARFECDVNDGFAELVLCKVTTRKARQRLVLVHRAVDAPSFLALQLQQERLDVVVVWGKALRARRCQISEEGHSSKIRDKLRNKYRII